MTPKFKFKISSNIYKPKGTPHIYHFIENVKDLDEFFQKLESDKPQLKKWEDFNAFKELTRKKYEGYEGYIYTDNSMTIDASFGITITREPFILRGDELFNKHEKECDFDNMKEMLKIIEKNSEEDYIRGLVKIRGEEKLEIFYEKTLRKLARKKEAIYRLFRGYNRRRRM